VMLPGTFLECHDTVKISSRLFNIFMLNSHVKLANVKVQRGFIV